MINNGNGDDRLRLIRERAIREGQLVADTIALDIVNLIKKKYPQVHPGVVATALVHAMASMTVLFARDETDALGGVDAAHASLKKAVISMMARKRARDARRQP